MVGQTLLNYHIREQITLGGMEEVYLAEDIREHRQVVLKALPNAVRREPERMRRIRADVEAAMKLHHPNIVRVYSMEQGETQFGISQHFITMEFVVGQLLSRIIPAEGLPLTKILGWFSQLASALDEAHKRRVTHRDLKPENIIITGEDVPKILDFGLARIIRPDLDVRDSQSHTRSVDVLRTLMHSGAMLDGIAYMSPEQAEGRAPDHRTDIFSFGAMLYHAVTGDRPFSGESYVDLVSSIMRDEPEAVAVLKPSVPYILNQTIITCLQKDVRQRYQSMEKVAEELEEVRRIVEPRKVMEEKLSAKTRPVPLEDDIKKKESAATGLAASFTNRPVLPVAMFLLGVLLTWILVTQLSPAPVPRVRKLPIDLSGVSVDNGHRREDVTVAPIISPDGTKILYNTDDRLWVWDTSQYTSIEVPESFHSENPFWAPEGDKVGYFTKNDTSGIWTLHTIALGEQKSNFLTDLPVESFPIGATWRAGGDIIYSVSGGDDLEGTLYRVPATGGVTELYLAPDPDLGETGLQYPFAHPDGSSLLYSVFTIESMGRVVLYDGTSRKTLVERPDEILSHPLISKSGHLIYQRGLVESHTIWAVAFDGSETTGNPFLVTEYGENPSVSDNDILVYHAVMPSKYEQLIWIDRHGHIAGYIGQPQERIDNPTISPDGHKVAVTGTERGNTDIWVHEGYLGQKERVTKDAAYDYFPVWSPSGNQLAFSSVRNISSDIFLVSVDGKGRVLPFVTGRKSEWVASWSRDGRYLVYEVDDPVTKRDIWYIPMEGDRSPRPFLNTDAQEFYPNVSADGEFIAYQSNESGRAEIYISRFPSGRNKTQVSTNGGTAPRWTANGSELFYIEGSILMTSSLDLGSGGISAEEPQPLFSADHLGARMLGEYLEPAYDVAPDGERFVMVQRRRTSSILMVENWHIEFPEQ